MDHAYLGLVYQPPLGQTPLIRKKERMKLLKKEDVRWDVVRKASWLHLSGWPITAYYSKWGVSKEYPLFSSSHFLGRPNIVVKLPWCQSDRPNTQDRLRASVTFVWQGFLWFWRA